MVAMCAVLLMLPVLGKAEGTSMGKPFDELWDAVGRLQQQVETLVGQEENFISTEKYEADMAGMQGEIGTLSGRMDEYETDITGLQGQVDALTSRIDAMQATETLTCGVGSCTNTVPKYVDGVLQTCTPKIAMAEKCDGQDNDCDGQTDEDYPELGHNCLIPQYMITGIKVCHPSGTGIMCQAAF